MKLATWAAIIAIAGSGQAAATVYKCTAPDGKIEFRDSPCAGKAGGKIEVKPNTVTPIDQTSDRWLGDQISERARQRADEDEREALRRANARPAPVAVESSDAPVQYYYPGYFPRRHHASPPRPQPPEPPHTVTVKPKPRDDK